MAFTSWGVNVVPPPRGKSISSGTIFKECSGGLSTLTFALTFFCFLSVFPFAASLDFFALGDIASSKLLFLEAIIQETKIRGLWSTVCEVRLRMSSQRERPSQYERVRGRASENWKLYLRHEIVLMTSATFLSLDLHSLYLSTQWVRTTFQMNSRNLFLPSDFQV
jgi:hypothetical protein